MACAPPDTFPGHHRLLPSWRSRSAAAVRSRLRGSRAGPREWPSGLSGRGQGAAGLRVAQPDLTCRSGHLVGDLLNLEEAGGAQLKAAKRRPVEGVVALAWLRSSDPVQFVGQSCLSVAVLPGRWSYPGSITPACSAARRQPRFRAAVLVDVHR
jgi:hypothetical protein